MERDVRARRGGAVRGGGLAAALAGALLVAGAPAAAQEAAPPPPTPTAGPADEDAAKMGGPIGGRIGKALTGITIMRLRETQTLAKTEIAQLDIRIAEEGKFDIFRSLHRYVKREYGLERSLLRFDVPPRDRGLAVLTIEVKDGIDDQWLYVPELRKVKRVPRGQTTETFAGTGFAFEDLRHEALDAHRYRTLDRVELQGRPAYRILAEPIPGKVRAMQGYSKRVIYVDAERWVEMRIDFFDEKGALVKTQENSEWRPVGDIFRPYRVVMRELERGRTTYVKFRSWRANEPLEDDLFTTRELVREDH